jgi:hypothetical protein
VAELAIAGALGEGDLGDEAGFDPGDVALAGRIAER